jgi:hypothetical protein
VIFLEKTQPAMVTSRSCQGWSHRKSHRNTGKGTQEKAQEKVTATKFDKDAINI